MASDRDATYADRVEYDGAAIAPTVTWGINPGQAIGVDERVPHPASVADDERASLDEALDYMELKPGEPIAGTKIDVAFIGSCTNGRISDLREAARVARTGKVAPGVRTSSCPARRTCSARRRPKACPRSSATPASTGASRAARCVSR